MAYVCDSASSVGAAIWGGACGRPKHCCIRWGFTSCKDKRRFGGFLFTIFTMGNAIRSLTVKCFRFVCGNLTTFSFGKHIVGKLDSWAFGGIFTCKINAGVYKKLAKKEQLLYENFGIHSKGANVTRIFMNVCHVLPLPSAKQHQSYGDCLEVKREYYQNSSVLDCVTQSSQSRAHLCEQFLQVKQIGLVTLGPLHRA